MRYRASRVKRTRDTGEKLLARAKRARPPSKTAGTIRVFVDEILKSDEDEASDADTRNTILPEKDNCEKQRILHPTQENESPISKENNYDGIGDEKERPFGLPSKISIEEYRRNPVCHLSGFNYKVDARIGMGKKDAQRLLSVLDTGAGPNLIRLKCCPEQALKALDTQREIVNLRSASNHSLETIGVVHLTVTVGSHSARTPFVVVRNLGADVLLGCTYIDQNVETIKPRGRTVELINGDVVPVIRRQALRPIESQLPERKNVGPRAMSSFNGLRVSKTVIIPPQSETFVSVTSQTKGLRIIEGRQDLWQRKKVITASGIARVKTNVPFDVQVANFSKKPVRLQRGERIGSSLPVPIPGQEDEVCAAEAGDRDYDGFFDPTKVPEPFQEIWRNVCAISFEGEAEPVPHTVQPDPEETIPENPDPSFDDISLDHLSSERRSKVVRMAKRYQGLWGPALGAST